MPKVTTVSINGLFIVIAKNSSILDTTKTLYLNVFFCFYGSNTYAFLRDFSAAVANREIKIEFRIYYIWHIQPF